jgi:hypothetical protein
MNSLKLGKITLGCYNNEVNEDDDDEDGDDEDGPTGRARMCCRSKHAGEQ